jgi:hypothetical protein
VGKKVLVLILLLSGFVKAQIFTDDFNIFSPDTTVGTSGWILDSIFIDQVFAGAGDELTDRIQGISDHYLIVNVFPADLVGFRVPGSPLISGGTGINFTGGDRRLHANNTATNYELDISTTDLSWCIWFETSGTSQSQHLLSKRVSASGWNFTIGSDDVTFGNYHTSSTNYKAGDYAISGSRKYFAYGKFDRDGNNTMILIDSSGVVDADTIDISFDSATNLRAIGTNFTVGSYGGSPTTNEFIGKIFAAKIAGQTLLSDKHFIEDAFLADGWTAAVGFVVADTLPTVFRDNWGFNQGIKYTTTANVTLGLKDGVDSTFALTTDSTRYTISFSTVTSLSGDSVLFGASDDSIWYPLPDSTFVTDSTLQIIFDGWKDDNYIYIDNVTVNTLDINDAPVITSASQDTAYINNYFKYTATATDADGDALAYKWSASPTWLTANVDTIVGTPTTGKVDTSFQVIAYEVSGPLGDTLVVTLKVLPDTNITTTTKKFETFPGFKGW